jgi:tetratricopeptide (TPR) repeat protein
LAEKANALNADAAIGWYQVAMYYYYYLKGDYERALEFRRLHPDQHAIHAYIEYIPVYGQLGRKDQALDNWHKLLAKDHGWTARELRELVPSIQHARPGHRQDDGRRLQVRRARGRDEARPMTQAGWGGGELHLR